MKGVDMFPRVHQAFLMFCLSMAVSGCIPLLIGGAAGVAGVVYVQGVAEKNFDSSLKSTHEAAIKALKAEGVYISSDELNVANSVIKGEFQNDEKVQVNIE